MAWIKPSIPSSSLPDAASVATESALSPNGAAPSLPDSTASHETTAAAASPAAGSVRKRRKHRRDEPAPGVDLNIRAFNLPFEAHRLEMEARIGARRTVTLEYQQQLSRYVVRGVESGGAIEAYGHYVTFCNSNGESLGWLQPVDSLSCNQTHAIVLAEELIRVEAVRVGRSYDLSITRHYPRSHPDRDKPDQGKPELVAETLFRGRQGFLGLALWGKDKELRGGVLPQFYSASGEDLPVPEQFAAAACAAIAGACCLGCKHAHFLRPAAPAQSQKKESPGDPLS
jgi:hypothetical protein